MTRSRKIKLTAFNQALKSDNKRYRHHCRAYTRKVTKDPDKAEDEVPKILREVSNPWDYD